MRYYINLYKEFDGSLTAHVYESLVQAAEDADCEEFVETIVKDIE